MTVDDPWGFGNSLEWATSLPAAAAQLHRLPRIRSERPAFELHYPHLVEQYRHEAHVGHKPSPYEKVAATQERESSPNGDEKAR